MIPPWPVSPSTITGIDTLSAIQPAIALLMANLSQQVYQMGRAQGLNKEDGSAIIKVFERMAGVTIGGDD
jgi:hypothetical protein